MDILTHLYQTDNNLMNQRKIEKAILVENENDFLLFRLSKGPTPLNSLPPMILNRNQKV